MLFDDKAEIALFSAKTFNVQGSLGIARKIQVPTVFLSDTDARPNLVAKSIAPPTWRNRIQRLKVPLIPTANRQPLDFEVFVTLQEQTGYSKV